MFRIIPRLDIKAPNLVKGIHFEGLRKIGNPATFARNYYTEGADELIYLDIVASLYGRNTLTDLVSETATNTYIPMTVGGGIRSKFDAINLAKAGADKVSLNTAALANPGLISDIADNLGEQAVVLNIEAKRQSDGVWHCFTESGRERTDKDVCEWIHETTELGVGEFLISSIDQDGTEDGFDLDLLDKVRSLTNKSVLIHGGFNSSEDAFSAYQHGADGVVISKSLHYAKTKISEIKSFLIEKGVEVRL